MIKQEVKGKKLLILGATGYFCEAVKAAKKLGIYTIVTDFFPNSPAKAIADKAYDISTVEIDQLEELARKEKVDGIFVAWSDVNHYVALELCERLGMPFYATYEQLYTFTNKHEFKECCRKYNVPTVPEFKLTAEMKPEDMAALEYPVIIKPSDSYGGKGITICRSNEDVPAAISEAMSKSPSGRFLTEKYMDDEHYDTIAAYYTIQDGEAAFSSMTDRCMNEFENNKRLNTSIFYPSQYLPRFLKEVDPHIKDMLRGMKIQNGVIFFEGCVNKEGFALWESGYRLCGAQQNIFPAYINGVDSQKMLICHALTGRMADENMLSKEDPFFKGKFACNGLIFLSPGKIESVSGIERVLKIPGVINMTCLRQSGDEIKSEDVGTLNQSLGRFHIVSDSRRGLYDIIENIIATLSVRSVDGREMCLRTYDPSDANKPRRWI